MSDFPSFIPIMEVGLRDGLQIESEILSTEQKIALIERLVRAGVRAIELGSFVSPKRVRNYCLWGADLKPRIRCSSSRVG
jgi:hydroxymethylglutaryl-CoA lyase